uniref:right-handed parallel beta-helix repeat-containing protein n=1 Tax=Candidatus Electronema sp. TaxID=2698783 RepID=UPI004057383F
MSRTALAFMSYVNEDDRHDNGWMTQFRERLSGEVRMHTGEPFDIFQDRKDIAWGQQWQDRINQSLDAVTFLIPILTPAFFKSAACRDELERFLKREETLGRSDLILPVYYVRCPVLQDKAKREHDKLAQVIAARQYVDWTKLRLKPLSAVPVRKALAKMAQQIVEALERRHSGNVIEPKETKAAPAVKIGPPTVVVDAWHRGDYTTITEALKVVKAGGKILVRPGFYSEGIVIDKPVEIVGDGERNDIVIEANGKHTVVFKATVGRLANLTLRQAGGGKWYGVEVTQGRLELEDCDISSQNRAGVAIHDSANPILRRNRIHDGKQGGVLVSDNGKGTLEDNEIFANAFSGVEIREGGNLTLRRNRISLNGYVGIWVYSGGGGIFEDNDLRDNAEGAWNIDPVCEREVHRRGNKE